MRSLVTRKDEDDAVHLYLLAIFAARLEWGDFDLGDGECLIQPVGVPFLRLLMHIKNDGQAVVWLKKLKQIGWRLRQGGLRPGRVRSAGGAVHATRALCNVPRMSALEAVANVTTCDEKTSSTADDGKL